MPNQQCQSTEGNLYCITAEWKQQNDSSLCFTYTAHTDEYNNGLRYSPDECKSVRLYFCESFVVGKSQNELEESVNDKRKSGERTVEGPRSRNDIELRTPALNGRSPDPWRSSSRFRFWFSTFRSLTSFCINISTEQTQHFKSRLVVTMIKIASSFYSIMLPMYNDLF